MNKFSLVKVSSCSKHWINEKYDPYWISRDNSLKVTELSNIDELFCITEGSPSVLDPPEHLFRIRLVCILLDTCGQYFDRGSLKRKLDCFLVYFQVLKSRYHTIPYHTVPYHTTQYHTIPHHTTPHNTIPYHAMPCYAMPCHAMHAIPYHTTPHFHTIL